VHLRAAAAPRSDEPDAAPAHYVRRPVEAPAVNDDHLNAGARARERVERSAD
jgi:hypothetical protein